MAIKVDNVDRAHQCRVLIPEEYSRQCVYVNSYMRITGFLPAVDV